MKYIDILLQSYFSEEAVVQKKLHSMSHTVRFMFSLTGHSKDTYKSSQISSDIFGFAVRYMYL